MRNALAEGFDTFVELGPGRTLAGIVRKLDRNSRALAAQDPESLAALCAALGS
jgi:[acyl-carrier-protein] S-malonyltransferase